MLDRVGALSRALQGYRVGEGDVVAILLTNRREFLEALFAATRLGAAFLPLNFRLAPDEWRFILGHGGATVLVTEDASARSPGRSTTWARSTWAG